MYRTRGNDQGETAVKAAILNAFEDVAMDDVQVGTGEDHDGEPAPFATIRLEAAQKRISGSRLIDAMAVASTAPREIDDYRFPNVTSLASDPESAENTRPAA